ncbi:hypothetical protein [Extibacter sp. GGCC_0201]|uniref:hypothetical protein n=1 Tax=Extibacter sp. GGCC_0201 TaxID=2731209 RepID=UPI001AA16B1A|nr:hypothetical protein [Extibacter sp. GGCC_0201]MBO1722358.1 hypothetical protein [Extibacter sp. GGCC_0201]
MSWLKFTYKLEQEEIEEALLDLNWRREGRFRTVNLWTLSLLGVLVLIGYIRNPELFYLFLLLLFIILTLFYMAYGMTYGRKRRAKKMAARDGEYRLEITDSAIISGDKSEKIKLDGKKLQFLCSDNVLVIRADRDVYTIPRRILEDGELEAFKRIAGRYKCSFIRIEVRKE